VVRQSPRQMMSRMNTNLPRSLVWTIEIDKLIFYYHHDNLRNIEG
jgi:hypothetical protein